jgi:hypothetical protein
MFHLGALQLHVNGLRLRRSELRVRLFHVGP